jgi:hypothetical protein
MKAGLFIVIFLAFLSSCKTLTTSTSSKSEKERDSIVYRFIERIDSIPYFLPADSASIRALLECDSLGRVHIRQLDILRSQRLTPSVQLIDNIIYIPVYCDSMMVYQIWHHRMESSFKGNQKDLQQNDSIEKVQYKTSWQWIVGAFVCGFIVCLIILVIIKFLSK